MIYFVVLDDDGLVATAGRAWNVPQGAIAVPDYTGSIAQLSRMVMTDHGLASRPLSAVVQSIGHQHTISNMPFGTKVTVFDVSGGELIDEFTAGTEGETETVDLPDPGTYDITVTAPIPALPIVLQVTT